MTMNPHTKAVVVPDHLTAMCAEWHGLKARIATMWSQYEAGEIDDAAVDQLYGPMVMEADALATRICRASPRTLEALTAQLAFWADASGEIDNRRAAILTNMTDGARAISAHTGAAS